ncbi:MAG: YdcF family protein [Desulfobacteraceae bacterium]|nr:MAG: YdcF family protein [Desulfobacteraceae bacterium]
MAWSMKKIELLTRILCDIRPERPVDAAYLYCQTRENQESVFQAARVLLRHSFAQEIWILNTTEKGGYPGFSDWQRQLLDMGLDRNRIVGVTDPETSGLHTRIESQALIRFAKKRGCRSLYVVAPPFHQLRAFMTAVTLALEEFPELRIYSFPGSALSWQAEVTHSQGKLKADRRSLIHEELLRIAAYQDKGDLALFDPVLQYLNQRDECAKKRKNG